MHVDTNLIDLMLKMYHHLNQESLILLVVATPLVVALTNNNCLLSKIIIKNWLNLEN